MGNYFNDDEYFTRLFVSDNLQRQVAESSELNAIDDGRLKEAYNQVADIRKFEIDLFWKRGTYYWAFILAAFTAHFALLALAITAFFCFFFSLAWTLVNKGSKFWQKNWEAHIDSLEDAVTGKLYKTFLNTNNKTEKEFTSNPFRYRSYDYSVTKITTLTSILLTLASLVLFLFYVILLFFKWRAEYVPFLNFVMWGIVPFCLLACAVTVITILLVKGKGSNFRDTKNTESHWYQRLMTNKTTEKIERKFILNFLSEKINTIREKKMAKFVIEGTVSELSFDEKVFKIKGSEGYSLKQGEKKYNVLCPEDMPKEGGTFVALVLSPDFKFPIIDDSGETTNKDLLLTAFNFGKRVKISISLEIADLQNGIDLQKLKEEIEKAKPNKSECQKICLSLLEN